MASILYIGYLQKGSTSAQRAMALQDLGHDLSLVSVTPLEFNTLTTAAYRFSFHSFRLGYNRYFPLFIKDPNAAALREAKSKKFDVLWIDKGVLIRPDVIETIQRLQPGIVTIGLVVDTMTMPHNQSKAFNAALPLYDAMITTKSYDLGYYEFVGVKKAYFLNNSYDPKTHRPVPVTPEERAEFGGEVGFIGEYEWQRARSIYHLGAAGEQVTVVGDWRTGKCHPHNKHVMKRMWGNDFAKALCATDMQLAFLRKINFDLQTTRSIEIPACRVMMLAERTDEHQALFEEGKEADYFSSDDELVDKVRYYKAHPDERRAIADAGYRRCIEGRYSYTERLDAIFKKILEDFGPIRNRA